MPDEISCRKVTLSFIPGMTRTARITLSTKGLELANGVSRHDFRFVSGSESFVCDRFQAVFVSPRIANMILNDPTLEEFILEHADSRSFPLIQQLICGSGIVIDDRNIEIVKDLIEDLDNLELSESILTFIEEQEEQNILNCIPRLKWKLLLGVGISRECDFIASHMSDFNIETIRELEINAIKDILSSNSLRIENEDWLFKFIVDLGPLYSRLFGCVRFEYLSTTSIDHFFENFGFDEMNDEILEQMRLRMRHPIVYQRNELSFDRFTEFYVNRSPESPWSGLIAHLTELCGGNVHEKQVVEITCSSTGRGHCWDVVNYRSDIHWDTNNVLNSWIQFDFKDRIVSVTHYALKSREEDSHHPLQWTLNGSMDGQTWTILDIQNTQELRGSSKTSIFRCNDGSSGSHFYRYIRLLQTGKNSSGYDFLVLSNAEFFGLMLKSTMSEFTCVI
jgi:hypothetical protein